VTEIGSAYKTKVANFKRLQDSVLSAAFQVITSNKQKITPKITTAKKTKVLLAVEKSMI
jgi:hypothetical protein